MVDRKLRHSGLVNLLIKACVESKYCRRKQILEYTKQVIIKDMGIGWYVGNKGYLYY